MIEKILTLLSKVADIFKARTSSEQAKTIEEQREEIYGLNERIRYKEAQESGRLNAQRAATEAGRHKNEEYRGK